MCADFNNIRFDAYSVAVLWCSMLHLRPVHSSNLEMLFLKVLYLVHVYIKQWKAIEFKNTFCACKRFLLS